MKRLLSIVATSLVAVTVLPASAQTSRVRDPAKQAFRAGVRLFNEEDFVGATAAFERAYKLRPHHNVQCNIARSYEQRARVLKAAQHYRRCLQEGAQQGRAAAEVQTSLLLMERQIAWILVRSPRRSGEIVVDGRKRGQTPGRVAVDPGAHVVELRWPGAAPQTRSVNLRGGQRQRVVFTPTAAAPTPPTRPIAEQGAKQAVRALAEAPAAQRGLVSSSRRGLSQWWFWSGVVVTAALAATAIVQSVEALDRAKAYEQSPDPHSYERAKRTRLLANLFWGGTAVAAGASTTLFFFTDFNTTKRERQVAVYGLGLRGAF